MPFAKIMGLDIGGANLKAAHSRGVARSHPFPLWKHPDQLDQQLTRLVQALPESDAWAVTMTGELCDAFPSKQAGVNAILDAVERVAAGKPVFVWQNDARFVAPALARVFYLNTASANWLATALFAGRFAPIDNGWLVDVGSTTTDIIALRDGRPQFKGRTDLDRLAAHELIYLGVGRTPLMAFQQHPDLARSPRGTLAAEVFATIGDVYVLLGDVPEDLEDRNTADGQPRTRDFAHVRLARMFCADPEQLPRSDVLVLAQQFRAVHQKVLHQYLDWRWDDDPTLRPQRIILAGSGEFFARQVLHRYRWDQVVNVLSLNELLGPSRSEAAAAYAVAVLLAEEQPG
ncbi:MAG TPA: hydantoinase/oxoprolinase family protein [Gemmatales bacterium]|nr:hydantoinase/oxoprolinase family protein [Gemmatales bacterium]HMP59741.1 hydantoinase/oxoprolinase family protein [Gemmatales bacterium]